MEAIAPPVSASMSCSICKVTVILSPTTVPWYQGAFFMLGETVPANIPFQTEGEGVRMETTQAMIVERIRSQQGAEKANEADSRLPDKVDTEANSDLLRPADPDQLTDIAGGNPAVG